MQNYIQYSILLFTQDRTESQSKTKLWEKWHHIFCAIETSGELHRLSKLVKNEKVNPLLALKKGGAYRTALNLSHLENNHPDFFKEYKKMLDNSDELHCIENKIKSKYSSRFAGNIIKEMDMMIYVLSKLVRCLEEVISFFSFFLLYYFICSFNRHLKV